MLTGRSARYGNIAVAIVAWSRITRRFVMAGRADHAAEQALVHVRQAGLVAAERPVALALEVVHAQSCSAAGPAEVARPVQRRSVGHVLRRWCARMPQSTGQPWRRRATGRDR